VCHWGRFSSPLLLSSPVIIISPVLHTDSFIYHRRYASATDSVLR
jgi:hypothetical protein